MLPVPGPRPGLGQGAGAGTPWARGRGWDPLGQGPGGRGPLGPRCRIHVESVTTYCQASHRLSGKLPTVRQSYLLSGKATYRQAKPYLLSGKLPTVRQSYLQSGKATYCQACTQPIHRHAPKRHRHAPNSIHIHAPNNRILCTQPSHRHAPKRHRLCIQK